MSWSGSDEEYPDDFHDSFESDQGAQEDLPPLSLDEQVQELAEGFGGFAALLPTITSRLTDIEEFLAEPPAGGPWCWRYLDADAQCELAEELRDWVDWLIPRYQLRILPPCWYRHSALLEELTALFVAWKSAYNPKAKSPNDNLIAWHDRWLHPWILRTSTTYSQNCQGGHNEDMAPASITDLDDFQSWLDGESAWRPAVVEDSDFVQLLGSGSATPLMREPDSPAWYKGRWWSRVQESPRRLSPGWSARDTATGRRLTHLINESPINPTTGEIQPGATVDVDAWRRRSTLASRGMKLIKSVAKPKE